MRTEEQSNLPAMRCMATQVGSWLIGTILCSAALVSAAPATFILEPKMGVAPLRVPVDIDKRKVVFAKEPDFGEVEVIRGAVPVGIGGTSSVAFAVDMSARKLYLDCNGNMDLTDDCAGVVKGKGGRFYVSFGDVTIDVPVGQTSISYRVRMSAFKHGESMSCTLRSNSYWEGDVELAGEKWWLGVVDNLDGVVGLGDVFSLQHPNSDEVREKRIWDCNRIPGASNLFVNGYLYNLSFAFARGDDGRLAVAVTPITNAVMRFIEIEGDNIRRLILRGTTPAFWDRPGSRTFVPNGEYRGATIVVASDLAPGVQYSADYERYTVLPGGDPVQLKAGGPLSNTVVVTRDGPELHLMYEVKGSEGLKYDRVGGRGTDRPKFTVRNNGVDVAGGTFEYG